MMIINMFDIMVSLRLNRGSTATKSKSANGRFFEIVGLLPGRSGGLASLQSREVQILGFIANF
jgi:hypothetical protein